MPDQEVTDSRAFVGADACIRPRVDASIDPYSVVRYNYKELPPLPILKPDKEKDANKRPRVLLIPPPDLPVPAVQGGAVETLLTHLIRLLQKRGLDTESVITAVNDRNMSVFRISEYIDQHCTQNLQVQELARLCGMSYSHFARLFRETYNQSCKEYIEFARMNKVEELLLFTNLDLNYIAQETGFSDCSHLIRTFRKWRGQTPKQWRKSQRM